MWCQGRRGASGIFQSSLGSLSPKISKLKHSSQRDIQIFFCPTLQVSMLPMRMVHISLSFFNWRIIALHGASLVAQTVKNPPATQETQVWSLGWEDPLEKGMEPTPVFFPGKFHGQRSLVAYSPQSCKELDMTERQLTLLFALQYCISSCCTKRWISPKYPYTPSVLNLHPLPHPSPISRHGALGWVPYVISNFPLAVLHMVMHMFYCWSLNSLTLSFPHCVHKSVLYACVSISTLEICLSLPFF